VAIKVLHGKITKHTDPLTMHWLRNAHLLGVQGRDECFRVQI